MGAVLIRSRSRPTSGARDCSTALFDAEGELVMQAEHIPVHLGSMPDAVAAILGEEQRAGDLWALNDPYRGDPPPRHHAESPRCSARRTARFSACRAHHADIGGPTPGGMPADRPLSPRRAS